jgi:SsrA-binding protein
MPSCSPQLIGFRVNRKDLMKDSSKKVVATNRKASQDYFLLDRLEAGIALHGSEIKSVRAGQVSLRESYVRIEDHEAWLINAHIAPYDPASTLNHEPRRPRRLLLHKREIRRLYDKVRIRGYSLIPTKMYLRKGRAGVRNNMTNVARSPSEMPNVICLVPCDVGVRDNPPIIILHRSFSTK